jgi:hypothetical protein
MSFMITFGIASTRQVRSPAFAVPGHMKDTGPTEGGETESGSPGSSQLSPGGGVRPRISDFRPDANRKMLIKGIG